jgi:signal peptidase I
MRHPRTRLLTGVAVLLLGVAWLVAGPAALGGTTTYVTTHGISMEPRFHTGDLALVRRAGQYRVGDVVAYRSAVLHSIVLHRIIGRDGDRYVFKGDNNTFVDPVHPDKGELIGRLWVRVPHGGSALGWLHTPIVAALLCGGVAVLLLAPARKRRRRGRRRGEPRSRPRGAPPVTGRPDRIANPNVQMVVTGCAAVAVLCLGIALLAWTRPATNPVAGKVSYSQKVRFSYRADAPAGAVYPTGIVRTGDPIFLRLVRRVRVKVAYRLVSTAPRKLAGTQEVLVRLTSPTGWRRTMQLQPPTSFTGSSSSASVLLDLDRLQALIHHVETLIGAPSGAAFTVEVVPRIRVKGTLGGQSLATRYDPPLSFQLDPLQLRSGAGAAAASSAPGTANGFAPSRSASVATVARTANRLTLRGYGLAVETARWAGVLGFMVALAAALVTTLRERRRPTDLSMQIHARYGHLIVPIAAIMHDPAQPVIDVTSIDALAQVAERSERVILHHHRIGAESYLVDDDGTLYRYQPRPYVLHEVAAAA